MKAIRIHELGGPEVLRFEEVEKPKPRAGQALVRISAIGVNFADTLLRRGLYLVKPELPVIPGSEAAGVVEEVGPGVDASLVGRRVAFIGGNCYAEYAVAPARQLLPLPDQMSFEEGAAFPVQALTAYHLLYTMDSVREGKSVLVHAAAGGTGLMAVQMAKMAGALVFGTTSSHEKAQLVRQMGADHVIIYTEEDVSQRVRELTKGRGVDLVLDSVGKATFNSSLSALAPFGHLIVYGMASGRTDPFDIGRLFESSQKVSAFWLVTAMRSPELMRRSVEQVLEWIAAGKIKIIIGLKLPLSEAAEAHRRMEARQTTGKIILTT